MDENRKYALGRFLNDTLNHKMEVLLDNGLYRHLKFTRGGSSVYRFDLITWPGHLCVCGDMGTFVFMRVDDMFRFFRSDEGKLNINPAYWAEKCQAGKDALEEYRPEIFKQRIEEWMDDAEFSREAREAVADEVLSYADDGEHEAIRAALDFEMEGQQGFPDFYECRLRDWTFHYLWICYAIVWGIQQYDTNQSFKRTAKSAAA